MRKRHISIIGSEVGADEMLDTAGHGCVTHREESKYHKSVKLDPVEIQKMDVHAAVLEILQNIQLLSSIPTTHQKDWCKFRELYRFLFQSPLSRYRKYRMHALPSLWETQLSVLRGDIDELLSSIVVKYPL